MSHTTQQLKTHTLIHTLCSNFQLSFYLFPLGERAARSLRSVPSDLPAHPRRPTRSSVGHRRSTTIFPRRHGANSAGEHHAQEKWTPPMHGEKLCSSEKYSFSFVNDPRRHYSSIKAKPVSLAVWKATLSALKYSYLKFHHAHFHTPQGSFSNTVVLQLRWLFLLKL